MKSLKLSNWNTYAMDVLYLFTFKRWTVQSITRRVHPSVLRDIQHWSGLSMVKR